MKINAGTDTEYANALQELQIFLVTVQRHVIAHGHRVLIILEGRDAAGKDGTIKRITEHLSPRDTRVVALGKPSDRERGQWYFQRYTPHLPGAGEFVLFNRSWYNRAGVERVMSFCSDAEYDAFMEGVVPFETMLVASGIQLIKYYLDISRDEQRRRLKDRAQDPLKQWKVSAVDQVADKYWKEYTGARDTMLERTSHRAAPWIVVASDNKKSARINLIRDLLRRIDCPERADHWASPASDIVFEHGSRRHAKLER